MRRYKNIKVILIRPGLVISPQSEGDWIFKLKSGKFIFEICRYILYKAYTEVFLAFLITGRILITRQSFLPIKKYYTKRIPLSLSFQHSLCYSSTCKDRLKTINESACVIYNPLLGNKINEGNIKELNSRVMLILSDDILLLRGIKDISENEAKLLYQDRVLKVYKYFLKMGLDIDIRLKISDHHKYLPNELINRINILDSSIDIICQMAGYRYIAGFITTPLMFLETHSDNKIIISFQLIDNMWYNRFEDSIRIKFIKLNKLEDYDCSPLGEINKLIPAKKTIHSFI